MRCLLGTLAAVLTAGVLAGCQGPAPQSGPLTYEAALSDFNKMFDTTVEVLDRYAVIRFADHQMGRIEAERLMTNDLFRKTRKVIEVRIFRNYRYHDLQVRVWNEIEESEPGPWNPDPEYNWRKVSEDEFFETLLHNEVILALTDNEHLKKYNPQHHPYPYIEETPSEEREPGLHPVGPTEPAGGEPPIVRVQLTNTPMPAVETPPLYPDLTAIGIKHLREGEPGVAVISFRSALAEHPGSRSLTLLAIEAHLDRGELEDAGDLLRTALRQNPDWFETPIDVRLAYLDDRQVQQQHRLLQAAIQADGSATSTLLKGYLEAASGSPRTAQDTLRRGALAHPNDLEMRILLVRLQQGT